MQEEIVKELDGYQAVIDGAKKVVDNWHPTLPTNPNWQKVKFSSLYLIPSKNGLTKPSAIRGEGYKMINMGELFANNKIGNIPMELVPLSESEKEKNEILNNREKCILITSLLYAMDKIANTCGHYDAYRKNGELGRKIELAVPNIEKTNFSNEIYNEDINNLVKVVKADVIYLDPPYNSRQYCVHIIY